MSTSTGVPRGVSAQPGFFRALNHPSNCQFTQDTRIFIDTNSTLEEVAYVKCITERGAAEGVTHSFPIHRAPGRKGRSLLSRARGRGSLDEGQEANLEEWRGYELLTGAEIQYDLAQLEVSPSHASACGSFFGTLCLCFCLCRVVVC